MRDRIYDGGAYCRTAFEAINKTATAGSTGDATEVDCAWVSRLGDKGLAMSAKLVIAYTTALGQGNTLSFAMNFQDADTVGGSGAADYGDAVSATVAATGDSGGSTETGTFEIDVDLGGAREFIRAQVTPDLNRANTDTLEWSAVLVFFGDGRQPATQAVASVAAA